MTLDKFTLKAQEALQQAQQIASERNQQQIDAEHLLAALLNDTEGIPVAVIKKLGASVEHIKQETEKALDKLPKVYGTGAGGLGNVYI